MASKVTSIPVDGIRLAAEVYSPPEPSPRQDTIVFVHGFAGNRHENGLFDALAADAAAQGFQAITYDWRGLGGSGGDFAGSTLREHVDDFHMLLAWIRRNREGKGGRLHAVGFSLGAAVVGLALRDGARLDRLAYLSPAVRPDRAMWPRYNTREIWEEIEQHGFAQKPGSDARVGRPILESLRDTDLGWNAFSPGVPLLVCVGTADTRIPPSYSRELAVQHPGRDFAYVEFDGASHSFRPAETHWQPLSQKLTTWFGIPS